MQTLVSWAFRRPHSTPVVTPNVSVFSTQMQVRQHVSKVKKYKLKTKNAAKKRITSRGDVKSHPSRMSGRSRKINKRALAHGYRSLVQLMPNATKLAQGFKARATLKENQARRAKTAVPAEVVPVKRVIPSGPPQHPLVPGYVLKNYSVHE